MPLTETQKQALRQKFPRLFEGQPSGLLLEPEPPTAASRLTDDQRNELRRKFGLPGAPPEPKPPGFLSRVTSSILSALPALGTGEPVAEVALPAEAELPSLADLPVPPAIPLGRIKQALLEAPRADEAEPTAFSRVGRKVQEAVLSLFPTEEEFQTGPVGRLRVAMGIQVLAPGEKTPADVMGARKEITQAEKVLAPVAFPIIMALKTAEVGVRAMFAPVVGFLAGLHQGFVELGMSETDAARAVKDVEAGFISLIATGTPIPRGPYRLSGLREPKVDLATMSFDDFVRLAEETGGYSGLLRELRRKSPERFEEIRELLRERSRGGFEAGKEASSKAREPVAAIPGEVLPAAPVAAPVAAEIARPAPAPAPPAVRPAIPGPEGTVAAPTVPGAVQAPPAPTVPAKALGLRDRILAEVPEAGVRVTGELAKTIGVSQKELIPVLQELDREGGILVFTPGPTPNAGVVQRHSPRTVEVIEPVTEEILRAVRSRVQQEGATNLYNLATELRVSPRTIQEAVESLAGEGFKVSRRAVRVEGERAWDVMIEGPRAVKGQPGQLYVLHQGEQYPIESLEDASKKFTALVKAAEAGAGDVPDTVIVDESGAVVGYIAYNGRIFPGRSEEWKPGLKPLYDPRQEAGRVPQLGEAPPPEPPALQPGTTPLPEPKVARPAKPPVPAKPKPPEAEPLPSGVTEQEVFDRIQAIRRTTEDIRSGAEPGRVVIFDPEALTEGRKRPIGAIAGQGKPPGQRDAERRGVEPEDPEVSTRRVAAPTAPTPTSPLHRGWKPPSSPQAAHAKEMKKADIIRTLSEGLGVPIRVGKFRQRALGVFKRHPRVIRLRNVNDVATAAHEVGHYLQRVFFHLFGSKALSAVRAEVESLAIPGGPPFNEGFAEFTRLYVTDPAAVQSRAPNLLAAFDRALHAEAPEVLGILLEARDMLDRWENQPGRARVRAQIHFGTETKHLSIPQMWDRFQTAVLDDLHHIEVAERELLQGLPEIPADQKPYLLGRVSRGQEFGIAEVFLKHGLVDFETLGVSGKALQPIYQEAERLVLSRGDELDKALAKQGLALRVLDEYLVARRVPNLLRRKRKTGIRLEDARDTLRALEYLEPVAAELDAYQKAVSKFVRDSYGVSDAEWAPIEEANEHYAPFYRFIEDEYLGAMGVMARKGFADQPRFFRRLKGSEREILPPTESILKNTYAMIHMAVRNNVAAALVNLAGRREGQGYLVEKVPAQMKPTSFELERIRKALEEAGFDVTKEEGNLSVVATVFTPTKQPGKNEIGVWLGGKKQFFEIGDEWLWRSMTALDRKAADAFVRLLQLPVVKQLVVGPARLRRATATTISPEFILRNPLRDNLEAFLLAEFGFRPGLDLWRGVMHMVNADETWQAWLAGGGPMATVVSMDRLKLQQTVQTLLERGLAKKAMKVVRNPLEGLRAISEAMELGTRLGVFDKSLREIERRASGRSKPLPTAQEALDSLREMGKSREALVEAGLASREATIDFGRMGLYTRGLSMMTAFWNAGVQGLDRFRRAFRDHPGRTFKRGAVLTVASLLVYLANRDDEDYYRLPTWRRGTGWNLKIGGTWWWLPTPWLGGLVFAIVPTRMFEFVDRQDRRILDRVADDVTRSIDVIPFLNAWPTVLEPFVENFANWKFFFDRPIVPRALEGVDPVFQATRETSEVSKAISKALNEVGVGYPPAKIDNVILSWTAALGRVGLQAIDAAVDRLDKGPPRPSPTLADLPVVRAFVQRYPTMQAQPIVDFWELFRDVEQAARSVRLLEREGRGEELARFQDRNRERLALFQFLAEKGGVHDQMQELRKGMDEVDRSVSVSPEEKRVRLDRLILASIRVAEAGLAGSELIRGRMREHRAVAPKKVAERLGTTPATPRAPELRRPEASP